MRARKNVANVTPDEREAFADAVTTAVEPAKIAFVADAGKARLDVPKRLAVRSEVVRGSTRRPITIADGLLATLLGTPGTVGKSKRFRLSFAAAGIDVDVADRSTTSGRFAYDHRG